jgi:hypothetical protein
MDEKRRMRSRLAHLELSTLDPQPSTPKKPGNLEITWQLPSETRARSKQLGNFREKRTSAPKRPVKSWNIQTMENTKGHTMTASSVCSVTSCSILPACIAYESIHRGSQKRGILNPQPSPVCRLRPRGSSRHAPPSPVSCYRTSMGPIFPRLLAPRRIGIRMPRVASRGQCMPPLFFSGRIER